MKQPTPAAWKKALVAWEWAHNELMKQELAPHEREALFVLHDMIRMRASGGKGDE